MATSFDSFVILAAMRTGSNFLEANLNAAEGIACHGELFNPYFIGRKNLESYMDIPLAERDKDPLRLLAALREADGVMPGFRFFHDHDPRVFQHVIANRNCAKIVLTRDPLESYVSLKIARETDQWLLRNVKNRRFAKVTFDRAEFEQHLSVLNGFYAKIDRDLQLSGQTAFRLCYEEVGDLAVMNGLLTYLGARAPLKAISTDIKRQNPGPLSEKVTNPAELDAARQDIGAGAGDAPPRLRGARVPGFVAAARAPVLFQPVKGCDQERVETWLAGLDGAGTGDLIQGFNQQSLRKWKQDVAAPISFTVLAHPVRRAHRVFCRHILETGDGAFTTLRDMLRRREKLPLPAGAPGDDYDLDAHRAAFTGFLKFLRRNQNGQTDFRIAGPWATQFSLVAGMAQVSPPDLVLREEDLAPGLAYLAAQAGLQGPVLADASTDGPHALRDIYDAKIEAAVRAVYKRDYVSFGFGDWPG